MPAGQKRSANDLRPQAALPGVAAAADSGVAGAGVTANAVTLRSRGARLVPRALAPRSRLRRARAALLLLLPRGCFARMALNAIDGMLAREHGQKIELGALLNELGDVVSDAALYLPFALVPRLRSPARGWRSSCSRAQRDDRRARPDDRREPPLRRADGEERPRLRLRPARPAAGSRRDARACGRGAGCDPRAAAR